MKTTEKIKISKSMSASNVYNSMPMGTKTTMSEAKRTLEAIEKVQTVPFLTRRLENV